MRATLLLAAVAVVGCDKPSKCIEGASAACTCPSGLSGAQVCKADGTFAECACERGRGVPNTGETTPIGRLEPNPELDNLDDAQPEPSRLPGGWSRRAERSGHDAARPESEGWRAPYYPIGIWPVRLLGHCRRPTRLSSPSPGDFPNPPQPLTVTQSLEWDQRMESPKRVPLIALKGALRWKLTFRRTPVCYPARIGCLDPMIEKQQQRRCYSTS